MQDSIAAAALARIEQLIRVGDLRAALAECQQLVRQQPANARLWFQLGQIQLFGGDLAAAEAALLEATRLSPNVALYWTNLSIALLGRGRAGDAERCARQAIAVDATSDTVWLNLGNALYHQSQWEQAAAAYREAATRQPQSAAAWSNIGSAELRQGNLDAAQHALEQSLAISCVPQTAAMYGSLLLNRGNPQRAIDALRAALAQAPEMADAWCELGEALGLTGRVNEAEAACRRALQIDPAFRRARQTLALSLVTQFRLAEAEHETLQLVADDPRDAEAWALLAGIQQAAGKIPDALISFERSLAIAPSPLRHSQWLAAMQYAESATPESLLAAHRAWDETHAAPIAAPAGPASRRAPRGPLRIGFVSANFGHHPIASLALPALENLDRSRCNVILYSDRHAEDSVTARFRAAADQWHPVAGMSDEELAEQIRRDQIDFLIDLMGHTGRRLTVFARRPAPVQATWLGYVGTTGLTAMDYLLADRFHVRPGEESWYFESILRLPNSYACYRPPAYLPEICELPAAATGRITYGSFSNPAKLSPMLLDAWATILQRASASQLLLKFAGLHESHVSGPIRERFLQRGIAADRIRFEAGSPHPEFLAAYGQIDLALDTQPYSGGVTTCEALWMGVPVITFPGRTFAGRHATSYLSSAGLTEFIADDLSCYVDLAVSWSGRLDDLAAVRRSLRHRVEQSPIGDAATFAGDVLTVLEVAVRNGQGRLR